VNGEPLRADRRLLLVGGVATVCVVALLATVAASVLGWSTDRQVTVDRGAFSRVEVTVGGAATVRGTAEPAVRADWSLSWSLRRPHVRRTLHGGTLRLWVTCPGSPGRRCTSDVVLSVPATAGVVVDASGRIDVRGIRGGVDVSSLGGPLEVADVSGPLRLWTRDGSANARDLSASTVVASDQNGSLRLDFAMPPTRVDVETRDGHATVALPDVPGGYALDIDQRDGSSVVDVPTNPRSARSVRIGTRDGEITVEPAPGG
jgi:hypothetical protein